MVCITGTWICAFYPIATDDSRSVVYQRTIFLDFETSENVFAIDIAPKRLNHITLLPIDAEMVDNLNIDLLLNKFIGKSSEGTFAVVNK